MADLEFKLDEDVVVEMVARLTARVAELEQEATELEGMLHNKALDSVRIASELTDQLEAAEKRVEELSAELAACRKALEAARRDITARSEAWERVGWHVAAKELRGVGRLLREDALASAGKDSGPTCSRCGGSGRHPTSGGDCKPCDGSGKDSGEGNPPGIPDSSPEPAATVPRGEVEELLRRIVKYAIEDRAYTPGSTRLARAINEARKLLAKAEETP